MFILEVYDLDECWSTFGVFSTRKQVKAAKAYVTQAYNAEFLVELSDSDFQVKEVELNKYLLKEVGL
jgi:hypothetical protein